MGIGFVLKGATFEPLPQGSDCYGTCIAAEGAFPHSGDSPASVKKLTLGAAVAGHIVIELRLPELRPCRGCRRVRASFMAVPEAAVNEANGAVASKDKIRGSGQMSSVESEAKPLCVKRASKDKFGLGVLGRYGCHHSRSSGLVDDVGHRVRGPWSKLPEVSISREVVIESKWKRLTVATVTEVALRGRIHGRIGTQSRALGAA